MKTLFLRVIAASFLFQPVFSIADILGDSDNIRVEFQTKRRVKDLKTGSLGAKSATFNPVLRITNSSIRNFSDVQVCIMMLGEDTTTPNNWRVIKREEISVDLPTSKTFTWEGETFTQGFDKFMAKSGYEYDGYIILLKNSEGEIVQEFATKNFWITNPETAWRLEQGKTYQREDFR